MTKGPNMVNVQGETVVSDPETIIPQRSDITYLPHDAVQIPAAEVRAKDGLRAKVTRVGAAIGGHDACGGIPFALLPELLIEGMIIIPSIRNGQVVKSLFIG
jgi:hypothetical protein